MFLLCIGLKSPALLSLDSILAASWSFHCALPKFSQCSSWTAQFSTLLFKSQKKTRGPFSICGLHIIPSQCTNALAHDYNPIFSGSTLLMCTINFPKDEESAKITGQEYTYLEPHFTPCMKVCYIFLNKLAQQCISSGVPTILPNWSQCGQF